jgi:hypothetical protein
MWLSANIFVVIAASANTWMADTILAAPDPPLAKVVKQLGYDTVRQVMRQESAEVSRFLFFGWGWVELAIALVVLGMLLSLKSGPVQLASGVLALLMTLAMHFLLTPQIASLGRVLDFVPAGGMIAERSRLDSMIGLYNVSRALVMVLSAGLFVAFLRRNRSRRLHGKSINQIDLVDDADNAHVDR